jgi:outer membrane protein assembly factor BamB
LYLGLLVLCAAQAARSASQIPKVEAWQYPTEAGGLTSPPVVGRDGTIYLGSADKYFYALNPDGTIKWKERIGYGIPFSAALAADGTIYVPSYGLYALRPNGSRKWRFPVRSWYISAPALARDGAIYGHGSPETLAIGADGQSLWSARIFADPFFPPVIAADGTLYSSGNRRDRAGMKIVAFTPTGAEKWSFDTEDILHGGIALAADGTLYFGGLHKILYAIDATGKEKWRFNAEGAIGSSPAIGKDGMIYFGASDGKLYALRPDGTLQWTFPTPAQIICSPAVDTAGTIYFTSTGSPGKLYAVSEDGRLQWTAIGSSNPRTKLNFKGTGSPVIDPEGMLYVSDSNGSLYAFSIGHPPADSSWPMARHDSAGTGRQSPSADN